MLELALERFELNLKRVENLASLYEPAGRQGRRKVSETDVLRAAVVMLHAAMEDLLRSVVISAAPNMDASLLNEFPLVGSNKKQPKAFQLGSLAAHRGKTINEILDDSVKEYCNNYQTFNHLGDIKKSLAHIGVVEDDIPENYQQSLTDMTARRHKIVHQADRNEDVKGRGNHKVKSISTKQVEVFIEAVRSIGNLVREKTIKPT